MTVAGSEPPLRLVPERRFPPYAYLPGRFPHPVRDAAGHSYGGHAAWAGAAVQDADAFLWGADLFNHGYYWEAHEAWEPLWRAADLRGPLRPVLKGLILLAAAGVKLRERKSAAAARHGRRAAALLRGAASVSQRPVVGQLGLSAARLAAEAEAATAACPASAPVPAAPEIVFPFRIGQARGGDGEDGWSQPIA